MNRLDLASKAPPPPSEFSVIAADGSHIDVDRHSPVRCYLINIGSVSLRYGKGSGAFLASEPTLYSGDDLTIADPTGYSQEVPIEGPLLGIKRSVLECRKLAELAQDLNEDTPALGLLDGSLILWGLGGQDIPEFVKKAMLEDGLLVPLNLLRRMSSRRMLTVASYISLPRSTEVVNILRVALCPYKVADCDRYCSGKRSDQKRGCEAMDGLRDRDLFQQLLSAGERSALFRNRSKIVRERYREHAIVFFYLNAGAEIARVELPHWATEREDLLSLVHALVFDECQRGQGYPVALSEAHEKAVVTTADREQFWHLVELALTRSDLSTQTSAKSQSKRTRWV